jgi:hypothetical protein
VRVRLPRGRWDVSLQYVSATPVDVRAPGLSKSIAANFGRSTSYWPAGTLTSDGRSLTLSVTAQGRSWFGRLLGEPRSVLAAALPDRTPIGQVAFTRHGATPQRVPSTAACGRYVDWFAPAGSAMNGRSAVRG